MDFDQLGVTGASKSASSSFPASSYSAGTAAGGTSAASNITSAAVNSTGSAVAADTTQKAANQSANQSANKTDPALLKQSLSALNEFVQPHFGSLEFSVDEGSGRQVLKIVDKETNDVLMQLPSKEALALSKYIGKNNGNLIRESA
ncbi:flagellar protein FlaG [Undibacterium sp. SXout7W]|uniref:flagellar protein FlaG n=1 Tax=Undibacterium sp. SXout7W TaxID=3413049 RepID=UPI003BF2CE05